MGLFSSASPKDWKPATQHEAWVGIVFGITQLDGSFSDSELQTMSRQFIFNKMFVGVNSADVAQGIVHIGKNLGWLEFIKRCGTHVVAEDAPTVFAMACEIALVDGTLASEEQEVIEALAESMHLDPVLAKKIVEVYEIRMKYQRRS